MNSKNINRSIMTRARVGVLTLATVLMSISCSEDFLDIVPQDRIDKTSFYSTADQMLTAVNGVYAVQRNDYGNLNLFVMREGRSDNGQQNPNGQSEQISLDSFSETAGNLLVLDGWTNMYNTISLANSVIENGPKAEGNADLIARVIGEAKFLRALTYFNLVVLWGDVPLRTTITDVQDATVPRSSVADVYAQVVKDLNEAIAALPTSYDGSVNNEVGRATKYAAYTLLGKVELQRGNKAAAETAFRVVLDKYELLDNYADLYQAGNNNTAESIFEVNFNPANQTGYNITPNLVFQSELTRLGIASSGTTQPALFPTTSMMDAYEANDERKDASVAVSVAEGKPYIIKFLDYASAANGHDINIVVLRYADVLLGLAEAIGESPEAYDLINEVRDRAGLDPIDGTTTGTFTDKLMQERRVEFAFEQHRWFDLLRLPASEVTDIMTTQLTAQQGRTVTVTDDDLLFPIPQPEIDVAKGVVTQNTGY